MRNKKSIIFIAVFLIAFAIVVSATTVSYMKTIEVSTDINLSLNGQSFVPKDSSGNPVEVFVYNGTTYVPIRAISEAFGCDVGYDGNTKTAIINEKGKLPTNQSSTNNGIVVHEDEFVKISFLGCEEDSYDQYLIFYVVNKSTVTLTFQSNAMAIDGESLGYISGSDSIAAQSNGKIRFAAKETFPTLSPIAITGNIRVIDFSKSIFNGSQSYDIDFLNVDATSLY